MILKFSHIFQNTHVLFPKCGCFLTHNTYFILLTIFSFDLNLFRIKSYLYNLVILGFIPYNFEGDLFSLLRFLTGMRVGFLLQTPVSACALSAVIGAYSEQTWFGQWKYNLCMMNFLSFYLRTSIFCPHPYWQLPYRFLSSK